MAMSVSTHLGRRFPWRVGVHHVVRRRQDLHFRTAKTDMRCGAPLALRRGKKNVVMPKSFFSGCLQHFMGYNVLLVCKTPTDHRFLFLQP